MADVSRGPRVDEGFVTCERRQLERRRGRVVADDHSVCLVGPLEGLEQIVEVVSGTIPETVVVREGPIEYDVDLRKGQKTGLFLDQRENREAAARYARGRTRRRTESWSSTKSRRRVKAAAILGGRRLERES